jgi:heat shock protein HslJ
MHARLILAATAVLLLWSCTPAGGTTLAGSEWRPLELGGQPVPGSAEMFVAFGGDGALRGNGGCNGFFGTYEANGAALAIGALGATKMMCEADVMAGEDALLDILARTAAYERDGTSLVLRDGEGAVIARLAQTDAD